MAASTTSFVKSNFFVLIAFVFFLLATLVNGGIITASGLAWFVPAGLTSYMVALLVA